MVQRIETELMQTARQLTRDVLGRSKQFAQMDMSGQLAMYQDVVNANYEKLAFEAGLPGYVEEMASKPKRAVDLIDDERHYNKRIEEAGGLASDFVQDVDFPGFVRDLLKGVFDANLEVTLQQMETYKDLLKSAAGSIAKFIKDIDNTAAFGYLAENKPDEFNFQFDDDEKSEENPGGAVLTDKSGNKIDLGDNEIKAKIMDAKIQMAKEHRAMLREMILMGITRLVVEKGTVKASVLFDMKVQEQIKKSDKAMMRESQSYSKHAGGGFFGFIGGGKTKSSAKNQISVSSVKSQASTDLAVKMAGSVEIIFKTDYFKLDNFATMYAPQLTEGQKKENQANKAG